MSAIEIPDNDAPEAPGSECHDCEGTGCGGRDERHPGGWACETCDGAGYL